MSTTPTASGCNFLATTRNDGPDVGFLVSTSANGNAKKLFTTKALEANFGKSKKVTRLGDRAALAYKKGKIPQAVLLVVDGSNGVQVTLRDVASRADALTESTAIATAVLAALTGTVDTTTTTQAGG